MTSPSPQRPIQEPSYLDVGIPLIVLTLSVSGAVFLFGLGAIDGPVQVALLFSAMVAALVLLKNGHPWEEISAAGGRALTSIVSAIFILLAVGALSRYRSPALQRRYEQYVVDPVDHHRCSNIWDADGRIWLAGEVDQPVAVKGQNDTLNFSSSDPSMPDCHF